jgi:dipeptidyl aminopeptidase/acylaminoacyl peptidase
MAKGLRKPLLLVHGMMDPNVLYQDTVNVYRALLETGKEGLVDLFLDPEGEHGMGGAVKTVGWHRKYEAFWLQHLGRTAP